MQTNRTAISLRRTGKHGDGISLLHATNLHTQPPPDVVVTPTFVFPAVRWYRVWEVDGELKPDATDQTGRSYTCSQKDVC